MSILHADWGVLLQMGILLIYSAPVVLLDFSLTVKAAPHECVIRTSQPEA